MDAKIMVSTPPETRPFQDSERHFACAVMFSTGDVTEHGITQAVVAAVQGKEYAAVFV